jgi:hypothetical protein
MVTSTLLLELHLVGLSRVSRQKRREMILQELLIIKITSYIDIHCWYRNTWMAIERREKNVCWDLHPIRKGFYKLL